MSKKILLVSADDEFISTVNATVSSSIIITQDESYRSIDNYVTVIAILDLNSIDLSAKLLKRVKRDAVYIIIYTEDEREIEQFADIASDVWIKPLHPILLDKRLKTLSKIFDAQAEKSEYMSQLNYSARTNLSLMATYMYLLNKGFERDFSLDKLQGYIKRLQDSQQNLVNMLDNFVDFSRIEAGQLRFIQTTVSIQNILDEFKDIVDGFRGKHGVEMVLEISLAEGLPSVFVDIIQLQSIMHKIISYGCDFSHECILKFSAKTDGDFVNLSISINNYRSDDFINFFPYPLGQILEYSIEAQGGKIWLEIENSKDSNFCFTLPIARDE